MSPQSSSANFKIAKDIFDGGGNPSSSANLKLNESLGFPLETGRIESPAFKLEGGFYALEKLQPAFASVSGRVVDYQGQDPIAGARLIITGMTSTETVTDNLGRFSLQTLPLGTKYTLQPKHPGMFFQPPTREYAPLSNDQMNQDFIGSLYGDVSGNDEVRSFDASMVLRYVVRLLNWQNPARDSIAADVSGDGSIRSFDASLILRYAAGLITKFPVEGAATPKIAAGGQANTSVLRLETQPPTENNRRVVSISIEFSEPIYSGDFTLSFNPSVMKLAGVSAGEIAAGFIVTHASRKNEIHLAMAGAQPVQRNGALLHLEWEVFDETIAVVPAAISAAVLNDGGPAVQILNTSFHEAASPKNFYLWQNHPNPFNPSTMIQYQIPPVGNHFNDANRTRQEVRSFKVRLQVYNLLGETVRTVVDEVKQPGHYRAMWDGTDDRGQRVASGVYLCRLEAGDFVQVKKMLFLP